MRRTTWFGAAAAAVLMAAIPTANAAAAPPAGPVGTWLGTVRFDGVEVAAELAFHPGGVMCVVPFAGPDGGAEGVGRWRAADSTRFAFSVTERFYDGQGTTTGFVRADQVARRTGEQYVSAGRSELRDADGQPTGATMSTSSMRRTSPVPAPC